MITSLQRMVFNLLEPVGLVWAALGLFTLWALSRKRWRLALLPGLLALLMFVIGSTGFSGWLLGRLEKQHLAPPLPELPVADAVVVLGGGFEPSRLDAFGLGVTADGDRLFMGLELMRLGRGRALVLGGAEAALPDGQKRVEADMVRKWLEAWQLPQAPVISLGGCDNTREEALKVAQLCRERGWKQVVLVTSAYHMPRAVACFKTAGVPVIPVPCDFKTSVSLEGPPSFNLVPRYQGFVKMSLYVREKLAWALYRWRGWIDKKSS
jgi:uncharacterized SAM-binding protein YcdF (DUF218 family)